MTLPTKGRRSIHVDDIDYCYFVTFRKSDRAVIQSAAGKGPFIFVLPFEILRPSHIATIIKDAVAKGWNSTANRADYWYVFNINAEGRTCLEWLHRDDFRILTYNTRGILDESNKRWFDDDRQWYLREPPTVPIDDEGSSGKQ